MKLTISKSKNAEQLYICKSIRLNKKKTTSQIIRKLGSMESLLPQFDNDRTKVIAWAKEQARIMTEEEKQSTMKVAIEFSESVRHKKGEQLRFNAGYLFLQAIYYKLGLDKICNHISESTKTEYDLSDILAKLIYARIIAPASKLSSYEYSKNFLQGPSFALHDIYRSLDVMAKHSDEIQTQVYLNSQDLIDRNKEVLYYDCTNYFFELEEENGMKKYGRSKEHRPNPIIQMGLLMDGSGLPLAFTMFDGNKSEQPSLKPLEKKILKDFHLSEFVVCTDAGLAANANRKFNAVQGRSYIVTQSLKTLKAHLMQWALDPMGWHILGSNDDHNIENIDEELHKNTVFYKERWINENGLEQRLIVTFSLKHRNYQRTIRQRQINRASNIIDKGAIAETRNPNSPLRFVSETTVTSSGEITAEKIRTLDTNRIAYEEKFDGFYGVCTTLEDDIDKIISINKQRWQIEAAFRTMKSEFRARPVYLHKDNRIQAHFLTCFLSLLVLKLIERKLDNRFTCDELIHTLRDIQVHKVKGYGYLSSYTRTDITDALSDAFGITIDTEFISHKSMKNFFKSTAKS